MSTFRNFLASISPPWLLRFFGSRFVGALGFRADVIAEAATEAVKAPMLKQATSPDDALRPIAKERAIERAPGETMENFRDRLWDAWEIWGKAATEKFAAEALAPLGVEESSIHVIADRECNADPGSNYWSRFWIVIEGGGPWELDEWSAGGYWDEAGTWGSSATVEEVRSAIRNVNAYKSAHELGVSIILDFNGDVWCPLSPWDSGTWGNKKVCWPLGDFWAAKYSPGTWASKSPFQNAGYWLAKIEA